MKNENFLFGCGAFDVLCYVNATEESEKEKYGKRTKEWLDLFNYGTLPFYWGTYEPTEGDVRQAEMDKCVEFLTARGVTLKGHPLCWHTVCADWLLSYDDKTIFEKQLERINREVSHFKGKITYWDVINETVILPVFNKYDNAVSRICARYGRMTLIKEVFAAAKAADPEAQLLINDFNTTDKYEKVIEECLQAGVPIDAIGIQSHQHQGYWGAKKIKEVCASEAFLYLNLTPQQSIILLKDRSIDPIEFANKLLDQIKEEYENSCTASISSFFSISL